ncbi:MAG: M48 family metalloprotease [Planctomycetes bacterium]|nr:M48 family metalloprotease [Planctomycetota bacterium]
MSLPVTFLAGLLVLFANRELQRPIAGSGRPDELLSWALLLALPGLMALSALRSVRASLVTGREARMPPRALLRLSAVATPLCLHLVLGAGGWSDLAERAANGSQLADVLLLLLSLFLAEVPRLALATAAELHLEVADGALGRPVARVLLPSAADLWPVVRSRLGWPALLVMPCALFGAGIDLLRPQRELYTLFLTTTIGATAGTLVFFAVASMLLPFWFRVAFGVRRRLPEPAATALRRTAAALGFPPARVLFLPTGMRAMNAMMVGPLPVGRFLCVTDGLVRTLDVDALTGVVAHEVGHARRGHPLLLMTLAAVLPVLLPAPLRVLEIDSLDTASQALLAVAFVIGLWTVVRAVAHRFEHEADAASVEALGAWPCTHALAVVGRMGLPGRGGWLRRHFTLHPEEPRRAHFMRRYEQEPAFRAWFQASGRRLRATVAAVTIATAAVAGWAWAHEWPLEKAVWRFHAGDFVGAEAAMVAAGQRFGGNVPERWRQRWARLGEELAAAHELAPGASSWEEARAPLAAAAWTRGVAVLLGAGPRAARPWFALAIDADEPAELVRRTVFDYCEAAADEDPERMAAAAAVVRRLGVPPGLEPVFAEPPRR